MSKNNFCFFITGTTVFISTHYIVEFAKDLIPNRGSEAVFWLNLSILIFKLTGIYWFDTISFKTRIVGSCLLHIATFVLFLVLTKKTTKDQLFLLVYTAIGLTGFNQAFIEVSCGALVSCYKVENTKYYSSGTGLCGVVSTGLFFLFSVLDRSRFEQTLFFTVLYLLIPLNYFFLDGQKGEKKSVKQINLTEKSRIVFIDFWYFNFVIFSCYVCLGLFTGGFANQIKGSTEKRNLCLLLLRLTGFVGRSLPLFVAFDKLWLLSFFSLSAVVCALLDKETVYSYFTFTLCGLGYGAATSYSMVNIKKKFEREKASIGLSFVNFNCQLGNLVGAALGTLLKQLII